MRYFAIFLLFAQIAAAQFYVKDRQYRFPQGNAGCDRDKLCSFEEHIVPDGRNYSINFIEAKDNGALWDPDQLTAALDQIDKARFDGKQKPVVFLYIHGWHNNAAELPQAANANCTDHLYNGDVARFRTCGVDAIAQSYDPTKAGAPPSVVGIYMAWHGNDFNWPVLNLVPSYPIRRHFARKVGRMDLSKALDAILDRIREHRRDYYVVAMGHSFGSRVLENAAEAVTPRHPDGGFMQRYRNRSAGVSAENRQQGDELPPVDLMFHVNAASSHAVSLHTIADWKKACSGHDPPVGCDQPVYLAVSSRADLVTALVMPIANVVFFSPLSDAYHLIAAGNTPWIQTHRIPRPVPTCPTDLPHDSFCFSVDNASRTQEYEVESMKDRVPSTFWDMNTDHWIAAPEELLHMIPPFRQMIAQHWLISSHGDVWNPGVFNLVSTVVRNESAKRPEFTPRVAGGNPRRRRSSNPARGATKGKDSPAQN